MTDKQWQAVRGTPPLLRRQMVDVHTFAPFRLIRAIAPHFRAESAEPKAIVNISSTSGLHGNAGQANYSTAKAGGVRLATFDVLKASSA
jgi:3-oxoacyl-[acyl-carrier protein] reductase